MLWPQWLARPLPANSTLLTSPATSPSNLGASLHCHPPRCHRRRRRLRPAPRLPLRGHARACLHRRSPGHAGAQHSGGSVSTAVSPSVNHLHLTNPSPSHRTATPPPQPILVSGPPTHPAGAALAAAWDGGGSGGGRLVVVGSSEMWADAWLERGGAAEGNAALAEAAVAVRCLALPCPALGLLVGVGGCPVVRRTHSQPPTHTRTVAARGRGGDGDGGGRGCWPPHRRRPAAGPDRWQWRRRRRRRWRGGVGRRVVVACVAGGGAEGGAALGARAGAAAPGVSGGESARGGGRGPCTRCMPVRVPLTHHQCLHAHARVYTGARPAARRLHAPLLPGPPPLAGAGPGPARKGAGPLRAAERRQGQGAWGLAEGRGGWVGGWVKGRTCGREGWVKGRTEGFTTDHPRHDSVGGLPFAATGGARVPVPLAAAQVRRRMKGRRRRAGDQSSLVELSSVVELSSDTPHTRTYAISLPLPVLHAQPRRLPPGPPRAAPAGAGPGKSCALQSTPQGIVPIHSTLPSSVVAGDSLTSTTTSPPPPRASPSSPTSAASSSSSRSSRSSSSHLCQATALPPVMLLRPPPPPLLRPAAGAAAAGGAGGPGRRRGIC